MNFNQLQQLLVADGTTLTVTGAELASPRAAALLGAYFADATLTINDAIVTGSAAGETVTVRGRTILLAVEVALEAVFALRNGEAELTLNATPPDGWHFAMSYPALADTPLGRADLHDVRWTLSSAPDAPAAFWFRGGWSAPHALAPLGWLLGDGSTLQAEGSLVEVRGLPQVALTLGPSISHAFGTLAVAVQLNLQSTIYAGKFAGAPGVPSASYVLTTELAYSHGDSTVRVPLRAFFSDKPDSLVLVADTSEALSVPLGEIAQWIGGHELTSGSLPPTLAAETLSIDRLELAISTSGTLYAASMTLGVHGSWDAIPGVVTIDDLALNVYVTQPFDDSRTFLNTLSGTLALDIAGDAPVAIEVTATLPHFTLQGALRDDSSTASNSDGSGNDGGGGAGVGSDSHPDDDDPHGGTGIGAGRTGDADGTATAPSLAGFMAGSHGVGATAGFGDALTIRQLLFYAEPSASIYRFQIGVSGDWQLSPSLALTSLTLTLADTGGGVSAAADVGMKIGDLDLLLAAAYDSTCSGWQLSGATGPGQKIPIGEFLQDFDTMLGATTTLPASLRDATISNVAVSLNTASLNFTVQLDLSISMNDSRFDATVALAYLKTQSNAYQITFSGTVEVGGQRFALLFDEEPDA